MSPDDRLLNALEPFAAFGTARVEEILRAYFVQTPNKMLQVHDKEGNLLATLSINHFITAHEEYIRHRPPSVA